MIKYENDCVGCTSLGLSCVGSSCAYRNCPHYYCDECGDETDIYEYDDQQLCIDCIIEKLKKVE